MRLLLDFHVPGALAPALARHEIDAVHLKDWRGGLLLHASDEDILLAAHADGLVLVTADQQTIPGLLVEWASDEQAHSGVILLQDPDTSERNTGNLARALVAILADLGGVDWTNRIVPLPRSELR